MGLESWNGESGIVGQRPNGVLTKKQSVLTGVLDAACLDIV
jgi:hypothetical protein